jgi:hypothetical protein
VKTIKQIADGIGVDKQRVYRYIKKHCISEAHHDAVEAHHEALHEAHHDTGVMWFDEAAEMAIMQGLMQKTASSEAHHDAVEAHRDAHHEAHHDTVEVHQTASSDTVVDAVILVLQRELEIKNKQIEALGEALLNAQRQGEAALLLHAAEKRRLLTDGKPGLLAKLFGGRKKDV